MELCVCGHPLSAHANLGESCEADAVCGCTFYEPDDDTPPTDPWEMLAVNAMNCNDGYSA